MAWAEAHPESRRPTQRVGSRPSSGHSTNAVRRGADLDEFRGKSNNCDHQLQLAATA